MTKLRILFFNKLADMYDAERRIIKALPKLAEAATCDRLKAAFLSHLEETKQHAVRIKQIFKELGEKPRGRKCTATIGLLKEGEKAVAENTGQPTLNAALVSIGQKVEHYEIASYGCLYEWARLLKYYPAAQIIEEILTQERTCDDTLKEMAAEKNQQAIDEDFEWSPDRNRPQEVLLTSGGENNPAPTFVAMHEYDEPK
jgi:ferritin-like metal-binding protein YciE